MPRWNPETVWNKEDVFIIGGGSSLKDFDWSLLTEELTIGCNDAFRLGEDVCKVVIFGDMKWFKLRKKELSKFEGTVFTNCSQLQKSNDHWLWIVGREARGLHKNALGWNNNTGASAINLALLFGAKQVFLLGFDMKESKEGQPNWHDDRIEKHTLGIYGDKFIPQFGHIAADLKKKFPDCSIYNISDDTALTVFPIIGTKKFWTERLQSRKAG